MNADLCGSGSTSLPVQYFSSSSSVLVAQHSLYDTQLTEDHINDEQQFPLLKIIYISITIQLLQKLN